VKITRTCLDPLKGGIAVTALDLEFGYFSSPAAWCQSFFEDGFSESVRVPFSFVPAPEVKAAAEADARKSDWITQMNQLSEQTPGYGP
jgi:hypothetical protein